MHEFMDALCKELPGLQLEQFHHWDPDIYDLNVSSFKALLRRLNAWKSHGKRSRLYDTTRTSAALEGRQKYISAPTVVPPHLTCKKCCQHTSTTVSPPLMFSISMPPRPTCILAMKGCRFRLDEDIKAVVAQWFKQQPRSSLQRVSISWCVNEMSAWTPMGALFNSLYYFTQHKFPNSFFQTTFIFECTYLLMRYLKLRHAPSVIILVQFSSTTNSPEIYYTSP